MYGSEQPGQRCEPVSQPLVLHLPQTSSSNAKKVCFIQDWPICSNRSVLSSSAAHSIKILRNDRVIGLRQRKPVDWLVAVVTRVCSYRQADLRSGASHLGHVLDVPTMTSGPATRSGDSGPTACRIGGMTIDLVSPLTSSSISIGCIAAPMEIFPTISPALEVGRVRWQTLLK